MLKINPKAFNQKLLLSVESEKKKLLLFILVSVVLLLVDLSIIMRAQLKHLGNLNKRIVQLKKKLDDFNKDWRFFEEKKGSSRKPKIIRRFILREEVPRFLERISSLSYKNNVKIIKVSQEELKEKSPAVLVNLDLVCGYHNLGRFIADLENSEAVLEVSNLRINPKPEEILNHNVNLKIKVYVEK